MDYPVRSQWRRNEFESEGNRSRHFLVVPLYFFGSKRSTISRFGERFRDGQYTVRSVSCLLFFYSRCPRAQPFVKVGGSAPCPTESAPLYAGWPAGIVNGVTGLEASQTQISLS